MSRGPLLIECSDVAHAWATVLNEFTKLGTQEIAPLVVCITGFHNNIVCENQHIRRLLDTVLEDAGLQSIRAVANTIFPLSLWNPEFPPEALFTRYSNIVAKLRKYSLNRNGIYFQRMIDFQPKGSETSVNQLKYILSTRAGGNRRRSAYQISVIDPTHDDTDQRRRGFPCLQQVSVTPIGDSDLSITGFYATQTVFERAYGNFIGLCDLGRFFAHYWHMSLTRVTCIASIEQLDMTKTDARELAKSALNLVYANPEAATAVCEG